MPRTLLAAAVRWGDTWIDTITTSERPIALGTSLGGAADQYLATPRGDHAVLHVPADGTAVLAGQALAPGDHRLAAGDRATVEWGGLVFEVAWSDALEPLAGSARDGAEFIRVLGMTMVVHGVLVAAAMGTPKPQDLLGGFSKRNVHWTTSILEREKKKPAAKLALDTTRRPASGGAGPAAKNTKKPLKAKDVGLLALLDGHGATGSVFSRGPMTGLDIAMAGLTGPSVASGGDGLAGMSGRGGPGGGGTLDIGGVGSPGGREPGGRGGPALGRRELSVVPGTRISVENISKEEIGRVIRTHLPRFKYCYEKSLNSNPNSSGKVSVSFTIAPNGAVASAEVRETTLDSREVEACVVGVMQSLRFPQPRGGGMAVVTYPFVFASAGD